MRLTPDVTYQGVPLVGRAYDASLKLLAEMPVSAWRATTLDDYEHQAWVALHTAGVIYDVDTKPWITVALSEYGRVYASQRGVRYVAESVSSPLGRHS